MAIIYDIQIMGVNQKYWLPPDESIPKNIQLDGTLWQIESVESKATLPKELFSIDDMRTIIVRTQLTSGIAYIYYLMWLKPKNLSSLDRQVISETVQESEFADAIVTYYQSVICIDSCKKKWHALVASRLEAHISNPTGQNMAKLDKYDYPSCPNCATKFRIPVVKILGLVE